MTDRDEFYKLVNPVRMLICNKMYEHAHGLISELTNFRVYVTVNDDGYNEWKRDKEKKL